MTGPEHYREAEKYLSLLSRDRESQQWLVAVETGELAIAMQAAQVHAMLALTAATAFGSNDLPADDWDAWRAAAATAKAGWDGVLR